MFMFIPSGEGRSREELSALAGDERKYIQALYLDHYPALRSYVCSLGFPEDTAEDWLQETFLAAIRRIDVLHGCLSPRAYLLRILRNVIGYHLRRKRYAAGLAERLRQTGPEPEEYRDELAPELLYRGLIKEEELELLLRIYRDGLSRKELAEELGIDPEACNKRVQRAKAHLLAALEKDGLL